MNLATKCQDKVIELMVIKSVAGFMNGQGGTLLIGATDASEVFGIEKDLMILGSKQTCNGNSTRFLNTADALEYVSSHWH